MAAKKVDQHELDKQEELREEELREDRLRERPDDAGRVEVYEAERPKGRRVRITRNIDTGEHSVEPID